MLARKTCNLLYFINRPPVFSILGLERDGDPRQAVRGRIVGMVEHAQTFLHTLSPCMDRLMLDAPNQRLWLMATELTMFARTRWAGAATLELEELGREERGGGSRGFDSHAQFRGVVCNLLALLSLVCLAAAARTPAPSPRRAAAPR